MRWNSGGIWPGRCSAAGQRLGRGQGGGSGDRTGQCTARPAAGGQGCPGHCANPGCEADRAATVGRRGRSGHVGHRSRGGPARMRCPNCRYRGNVDAARGLDGDQEQPRGGNHRASDKTAVGRGDPAGRRSASIGAGSADHRDPSPLERGRGLQQHPAGQLHRQITFGTTGAPVGAAAPAATSPARSNRRSDPRAAASALAQAASAEARTSPAARSRARVDSGSSPGSDIATRRQVPGEDPGEQPRVAAAVPGQHAVRAQPVADRVDQPAAPGRACRAPETGARRQLHLGAQHHALAVGVDRCLDSGPASPVRPGAVPDQPGRRVPQDARRSSPRWPPPGPGARCGPAGSPPVRWPGRS